MICFSIHDEIIAFDSEEAAVSFRKAIGVALYPTVLSPADGRLAVYLSKRAAGFDPYYAFDAFDGNVHVACYSLWEYCATDDNSDVLWASSEQDARDQYATSRTVMPDH